MPRKQSTPSVGISSSVVMFLLLTSICCILSLSTTDVLGDQHNTMHDISGGTLKLIRVSTFIPNIAMLSVMSIGIVAMTVFVLKRDDLTVEDGESSSRHKHHREYSLRGITTFFIGVCILGVDYIVVELSCVDRWAHCYDNRVFLDHVFELIFRVVFIAFASCETVVCWMIKSLKFKQSRWIWHGLAVVQAANIALWFDSVLTDSDRRQNYHMHSFDAYFSLCNATHGNRNLSDAWCSKSSIGPQWFIISSPFLYPITIEFALLVSETFLGKIMGKKSYDKDENNNINEYEDLSEEEGSETEHTSLLGSRDANSNTETTPNSTNSSSSNVFIMISGIINIVYAVLSILMFIGSKFYTSYKPLYFQTFISIVMIYKAFYMMFLIACCAVGIQTCRRLKRERSYTSFLEYLLLFATAGGLLRAVKRIEAFALNSTSTDHWICPYYTFELVDMIEISLQIIFYYYAKDVKLSNDGERAESPARVAGFKNITVVIAISNFATWISDSFLLPEMSTSITPSNYFIERWPVFDNVVTPLLIFFRFNSALLFWCI